MGGCEEVEGRVNETDRKVVPVVAAVMTRGGQVLLAQRPEGTRHGGKWEFPGGKVENGEDDRAALKRELTEEFGIEVVVGGRLGEIEHHYPHIAIRLIAFHVEEWRGDLKPTEHQAVAWADFGELGNYDLADADRLLVDVMGPIQL